MRNTKESPREKELAVAATISDIFLRNVPQRRIDNAEEDSAIVNVEGGKSKSGPRPDELTAEDSARFLRIVAETLQVKRHYDLFHLMQGEIQHFIPHQIMISAWGDFRKWDLTVDVISAIPRVRTGRLDGCHIGSQCSINNLLKNLQARWAALGRQPLLVNNYADEYSKCSMSNCAPNTALQSMGSALVHGIHDHRDGIDSLYLALNPSSNVNGYGLHRSHFLIDALICQIDDAFRRVAGSKFAHTAVRDDSLRDLGDLSAREMEIMEIVSQGRTNLEIAQMLNISTFTVKNHLQRILGKLGATNRTEAVAKQHQRIQRVQRTNGSGDDMHAEHVV